MSLYEYLDLFIVIENLFFEKTVNLKNLKNNKIQLSVPREQRLKPYLEKNKLEEFYNLFEYYKKKRDFLLHK
jgi:hypothetical protein